MGIDIVIHRGPPPTPTIANFGGEGEVAGATNINSCVALIRVKSEVQIPDLVKADFTALPADWDARFDYVIGNRLPSHGLAAPLIAKEAFRILRPGGRVGFWSVTFGVNGWLPFLQGAGFKAVRTEAWKIKDADGRDFSQPYATGEKL